MQPETARLSLRDGFTAYFVLSPVTGLLPPSSLRSLLLAKLSASTGAPGPHDFAVRDAARARHSRAIRVHRIPPRVRDVAQRPSRRVRRASW